MSETGDTVVQVIGVLAGLGVTGTGVWASIKAVGSVIATNYAAREKAKEDAVTDAVKAKDDAYRAVIAGKDAVIAAQGSEIARLVTENTDVRRENRTLNETAIKSGQQNFERMVTTIESFRDEVHTLAEQNTKGGSR